jgi:2'-5' RNA ligase
MGHSVLVVPVPALEPFVRDRTACYDASFLSTDPMFVNAHITLLGPWLPQPSAAELARVGRIVADVPAFDFTLAEFDEFPDGVIYLRPEPAAPFAELTARLVAAFPQCPPYGGLFGTVVPHLTLDRRSPTVTRSTVRAAVGDLVPAHTRAERVDLQWWDNHDCHVRHSWKLGSDGS